MTYFQAVLDMVKKYITELERASEDNREAIKRVRELHRDVERYCYGCSEEADVPIEYPCTTTQVLDGEQ